MGGRPGPRVFLSSLSSPPLPPSCCTTPALPSFPTASSTNFSCSFCWASVRSSSLEAQLEGWGAGRGHGCVQKRKNDRQGAGSTSESSSGALRISLLLILLFQMWKLEPRAWRMLGKGFAPVISPRTWRVAVWYHLLRLGVMKCRKQVKLRV
jgi:hypothetical protein